MLPSKTLFVVYVLILSSDSMHGLHPDHKKPLLDEPSASTDQLGEVDLQAANPEQWLALVKVAFREAVNILMQPRVTNRADTTH